LSTSCPCLWTGKLIIKICKSFIKDFFLQFQLLKLLNSSTHYCKMLF
jgi:hypothetical protein